MDSAYICKAERPHVESKVRCCAPAIANPRPTHGNLSVSQHQILPCPPRQLCLGGYPRSFRTPGPQPRTDAAMWLKRYSGLLRLHAALLSPAEEFLLRPAGNGSHSSSLQLRSTFLFSPRRPRAADTVYILHYRHRYPVHGTGYASLFLNPCASVYTQLGQAAVRLPAFHCTSPLSKLS